MNLQHLHLHSSSRHECDARLLVDALNGDLNDRLLSLDLNGNNMSGEGARTLCEILSNPTRIPALLELRVDKVYYMAPRVFASIQQTLSVSKTLRILELVKPDRHFYSSEGDEKFAVAMEACRCIDRDAQGELLPSSLALSQKLAFLSVLRSKSSRPGAVYQVLDSFMASRVIEFAADVVHRHVIWRSVREDGSEDEEDEEDGGSDK